MVRHGSDPATGFLTRLEFDLAASGAIASSSRTRSVSVLVLHIDFLHRRHGRLSWELSTLAELVEPCLPDAALVARTGQDELTILIFAGEILAGQLAEEIRVAVETGFAEKSSDGVTVSIGIASGTSDSRVDSLTLDAHRCLIAAKAKGRNRTVSWGELRRQADELDVPMSLLQMEDETRVVLEELADRVAFKARLLYRQYSEQARTDPLTGLTNRGGFDRRMQREFENARKHHTLLTIGMIDVDDFGALNKQYSLVTGDTALRLMGDVLRNTVRSVDWVARYGGEEFCVVMPNTTVDEGHEVMERIRVAVNQFPIPTDDGHSIRITISAGVAQLMDSDRDVEHFISRASRQTNVAKQSGKNQISAYHH